MTGKDVLTILKVMHCRINKTTLHHILGVNDWGDPEEFDKIWDTYRTHGLFHLLCSLDDVNLEKVFDFARSHNY